MALSKISNSSHNNIDSSAYLHHLDLGDVGTSHGMLECNPSCTWETISYLPTMTNAKNWILTVYEKETTQKTHKGLLIPHIHLPKTTTIAYDFHIGGW